MQQWEKAIWFGFLITDSGGNSWCPWYIIRIGTLPQSWILLAERSQSVSHWRSLKVIGGHWKSLLIRLIRLMRLIRLISLRAPTVLINVSLNLLHFNRCKSLEQMIWFWFTCGQWLHFWLKFLWITHSSDNVSLTFPWYCLPYMVSWKHVREGMTPIDFLSSQCSNFVCQGRRRFLTISDPRWDQPISDIFI